MIEFTKIIFFTEFRYYMHINCPYILESFYKFGELYDRDGIQRVRHIDSTVFEVKNKSK